MAHSLTPVHDVFSVEGFELEEPLLVFVKAVILLDIIVSGKKEAAGSARWVVDSRLVYVDS